LSGRWPRRRGIRPSKSTSCWWERFSRDTWRLLWESLLVTLGIGLLLYPCSNTSSSSSAVMFVSGVSKPSRAADAWTPKYPPRCRLSSNSSSESRLLDQLPRRGYAFPEKITFLLYFSSSDGKLDTDKHPHILESSTLGCKSLKNRVPISGYLYHKQNQAQDRTSREFKNWGRWVRKLKRYSHLQCNIVQHWTVSRGLFVNCVSFSVSFRRVSSDTHVGALASVSTPKPKIVTGTTSARYVLNYDFISAVSVGYKLAACYKCCM
jgi:hypothetical protein